MYSSRRNSRGNNSIARSPRFAVRSIRSISSVPTFSVVSRDFYGPAQQRFHSGDKLHDRERLGQVVVASHSQAPHAVIDRAQRTQHQNGGTDLFFSQRLDDSEAVHAGQQPVDDHGVGLRRTCLVEALDAVGRPFNIKAAIGQFGFDFLSRFSVVFDE